MSNSSSARQSSVELVKQEEHAHLLPHVQRMKRLPKFGRGRARVPLPASQPEAPLTPPAKTS